MTFRIGPINIVAQPYWGPWRCDGAISLHPTLKLMRADCKCGFRTEEVPHRRYDEIMAILDWHAKDQRERFLKP